MTDVRTLLRSASPPPVTTMGINGVLDAARERRRARRRRFWVWATGLVVVTLGGPATGALISTSPSPTRVETARPVPRERDTTETTTVGTPAGAAAPRQSGALPRAGARSASPTTAPSSVTPRSESPTASPEGCRVDERSTSNVQLGEGGGGWAQYPSCTYVASTPGGYTAKGSWRIEIARGGVTFTIASPDAADCGTNVIQPGDEVTAYSRKGFNSPDDWFVAVGTGERC